MKRPRLNLLVCRLALIEIGIMTNDMIVEETEIGNLLPVVVYIICTFVCYVRGVRSRKRSSAEADMDYHHRRRGRH